jgi:hypothetical protein
MIDRLNDALRKIPQISKADLNRLLSEEKASKASKVKDRLKPKVRWCPP